ncbi:MAG: AmmeMemoRadiSam system protein B [Chloroflexota bacterium]
MKQSGARPAQLAGTWYTADQETLADEVSAFIEEAEVPAADREIVGLIAPHAGHRYSGPVAGYAYRTVQGGSYDTVVVVSPFHDGHRHPLLTTAHCCYQTPLGEVQVDQTRLKALGEELTERNQPGLLNVAYDREHAVEIQLPFLQTALSGEFKLLPLMLSGAQTAAAIDLGEALAEVLAGSSSLLVASTDLSHFYSEEDANQLDQAMLEAMTSFDPKEVIAVQRKGKGEACGLLAVICVITAAKLLGAADCRILNYATSGTVSGNYSRVVGYGAGVITK